MAHTEPISPTQAIARQVKAVRGRRGLSAQRLAERLAELGINWDRYTVTKLETGKRQNVTVAELFALGTALNISPVHLVVPPDADDTTLYQVTPEKVAPAKDVRAWIRGHQTLGNGPLKEFAAEAPEGEWVSFDTTTREGALAAVEWMKESGLGEVKKTGGGDG